MRGDVALPAGVLVAWLAVGCVYLTPDQAPDQPEAGAGESSFDADANASNADTNASDSTIDTASDAPPDLTTHEPVGDSYAEAAVDATDDPMAERPDEVPPDGPTDSDDRKEASPPAETCDYFVDPKMGGQDATFQTITAALLAASANDSGVRTICLAAGTYSESSNNEAFPLILRGVRLVGMGPDATIIQGLARVDNVAVPVLGGFLSLLENYVTASVIVGDKANTTEIAHLALTPPFALSGSEGIVCDRGITTGQGPTTGNTILDDVTIDGFDVSLRVTYSAAPDAAGCSALVTRSTFRNGVFGAFADGLPAADGAPPRRVAVQLGNGTMEGGNVFRNFSTRIGSLSWNGAGLVTLDAVTGVRVRYNRFSESDVGIWVAQSASDHFEIEQNDFASINNVGMRLSGPVIVNPLSGNKFHEVTSAGTMQGWPAIGLLFVCDSNAAFPSVRVRGNSFLGNDNGVQIRTGFDCSPLTLDFGTMNDPGGNTFRCNSSLAADASPGLSADFGVYVPNAPPGSTIPCEGNAWDHAPPSGDDLVVSGPSVDTANPVASSAPGCPAGRQP